MKWLDSVLVLTAGTGRRWRLWQRFLGCLPLLLVTCTCVVREPALPATTDPSLYVMAREGMGWSLAAANVHTGQISPLVAEIGGFAPLEAGFVVVLDGGSRLARWDRGRVRSLWNCRGQCRDPQIAPGGGHVTWIEDTPGRSEGWLLALDGGEAAPLGDLESRPAWSPGGDRLAAITSTGLVLWSVKGERVADLDLRLLAAQPSWAPSGDRLAVITEAGNALWLVPDLLGLSTEMTMMQPLGRVDEGVVQVSELAWNSTGERIALLRRRFFPPEEKQSDVSSDGDHERSSGAEALGPQPWLLLLEENEFTMLPGDSGAAFARPVWSADGRWLAAVRLPMGIPDPQPEVWVWDAETGKLLQRFPGAAAPAWEAN